MTINTQTNKSTVLGNGSQTQFAFGFIGVASAYISVILTDQFGNETVLTQGSGSSQYQIALNTPVEGALWGLGGTVTYDPSGTPIPFGSSLTIFRTLPLTQAISLQNLISLSTLGNGAESGLDTLEMQLQQVSEEFGRAITASIVDPDTIDLTLPAAAQRANMVLAFDSQGNVIAGSTPSTGIISTAMQPVVDAASIGLGQAAFGLTSVNILCIESFATNVYTLNAIAPNANPASYQNGQRFTFTATAVPTSNAFAIVGTLAELGIYTGYGDQAGAGDIQFGWSYTLEYSSTVDSGSPGFLLLDTPAPSQPFFNVVEFGATGNGSNDDTTAIQACINAAQAVGGIVFFPAGTYLISAALVITAHVAITGCGFQTDPINYGFGATPSGIDTRATGFKASVIVCGSANGAFAVSTTDSVSIEKIQITYPSFANSGVAAFLLNSATNAGVNLNSIIRDVLINNANIAIKVTDWVQFHFDNIYFVICTQPIIAENTTSVNVEGVTTSADCGDSKIINCTFLFTQGTAAIEILSGSGYRITDNKFNGQNPNVNNAAAILISPQNIGVPFQMTPGVIADNSIEGFTIGIFFTPNAASQGQLSLWTIVGNEFFTTIGIVMTSGTAIPQWMDGIVIAGNVFNFGQHSSASPCIVLAGIAGCLVANNGFSGASNQAGVSIGGHTSVIKITGNNYQNTQPAGAIGPALPATGVGSTNNTGYVATVNIFGGTVSSVTVAPAGGFGFSTVATATACTVTLNPGDQIIVNYSVTPTWIWHALNP